MCLLGVISLVSCVPFSGQPEPGPDKQASGTIYGAMVGAGSGAVTGAQFTSPAGPGIAVGAGFGAVFGMLSGIGLDILEEDQLFREYELQQIRELSWVQHRLSEHFNRRIELHPTRDIYPADWFFKSGQVKLSYEGKLLAKEIARLTRDRLPWSRIVVASYSKASDEKSSYAQYLNKQRSAALANSFIAAGLPSRRVFSRGVTLDAPILVDPADHPNRYAEAIEILPLDY